MVAWQPDRSDVADAVPPPGDPAACRHPKWVTTTGSRRAMLAGVDGWRDGMGYGDELRVRGRLSAHLVSEFRALAVVANVEPVVTVRAGPVDDQAALHGLIRRIEALGLELVEVRRLPQVSSGRDASRR